MERPISESSVPHPGYWRYVQAVNGHEFKHQSLKWLMVEIRKQREAMIATGHEGYDLEPGWQARVLHEICQQAGGNVPCEDYNPDTGTVNKRWLGITDMLRFLQTMGPWVAAGRPFVEDAEAKRRGEICLTCPKHQHIGCFGCHGILNEVISFLGHEPDQRLKGCEVCGCACAASVHIPLEFMQYPDLQFPSWCWKVTPK